MITFPDLQRGEGLLAWSARLKRALKPLLGLAGDGATIRVQPVGEVLVVSSMASTAVLPAHHIIPSGVRSIQVVAGDTFFHGEPRVSHAEETFDLEEDAAAGTYHLWVRGVFGVADADGTWGDRFVALDGDEADEVDVDGRLVAVNVKIGTLTVVSTGGVSRISAIVQHEEGDIMRYAINRPPEEEP